MCAEAARARSALAACSEVTFWDVANRVYWRTDIDIGDVVFGARHDNGEEAEQDSLHSVVDRLLDGAVGYTAMVDPGIWESSDHFDFQVALRTTCEVRAPVRLLARDAAVLRPGEVRIDKDM